MKTMYAQIREYKSNDNWNWKALECNTKKEYINMKNQIEMLKMQIEMLKMQIEEMIYYYEVLEQRNGTDCSKEIEHCKAFLEDLEK